MHVESRGSYNRQVRGARVIEELGYPFFCIGVRVGRGVRKDGSLFGSQTEESIGRLVAERIAARDDQGFVATFRATEFAAAVRTGNPVAPRFDAAGYQLHTMRIAQ